METLVTAFLTLAVLQNLLLTQAIGLNGALTASGRLDTALGHGAHAMLSVVPFAVFAWSLEHWLLQPANATSLRLLLWVPASLAASSVAAQALAKRFPTVWERLSTMGFSLAGTIALPLVVGWWVILHSQSPGQAALDASALGAGYAVGTALLAALHGRLATAGLPATVSLPAALVLCAAITSMVLLGIGGG